MKIQLNNSEEPIIPEGWRLLKEGELILFSDMFPYKDSWEHSEHNHRWQVMKGEIYIRKETN